MGKTTNAFHYFYGFSKSPFWLFLLLIQGQSTESSVWLSLWFSMMGLLWIGFSWGNSDRLSSAKIFTFMALRTQACKTRCASHLFGALAHSFPIYSVCFMAGSSGSPGITLWHPWLQSFLSAIFNLSLNLMKMPNKISSW